MSDAPKQVVNENRLLKILLKPLLSEKGSLVADRYNQYVFRVMPDATKPEVKQAVEHLFNVEVTGVQIARIKGKVKRFGQRMGRRQDIKKAYVKLKQGQEIDLVSSE